MLWRENRDISETNKKIAGLREIMNFKKLLSARRDVVSAQITAELSTRKRLLAECNNTQSHWLLKRFFRAWDENDPIHDNIVIIPGSKSTPPKMLEAAKEGIDNLLLPKLGVSISNNVGTYNESIEQVMREATYDGVIETEEAHSELTRIIGNSYYVIIHDADSFHKEEMRVVGRAAFNGSGSIILERAYTKGRFADGRFLPISTKEKYTYVKHLAAHENWHVITGLRDLTPTNHQERGLEEAEDCLGYSRFLVPGKFCKGCVDGAKALWYGRELRDKKQYFTEKYPHRISNKVFRVS